MLLLIELKFDLRSFNDADYSNIVAQVCAEADGILFHYRLILGCSVHNASVGLDRAPVQVILTDSLIWEFYYFDFSNMEVYRGETNTFCGFRGDPDHFLIIPTSEKAEEFLLYFKLGNQPFLCLLNEQVVETVLDTFATSYIYALIAVIEKVKKNNLGEDVLQLYLEAKRLGHEALQTLREANQLRENPIEADRIAIEGLDYLKERYTINNMQLNF